MKQQQAFAYLWSQHVNHDTSVATAKETRKIYRYTSKCQHSDGVEETQGKICQSMTKKDTILSFLNIHVNRIATISIELKGNEGQINMWTTMDHHGGKLVFLPKSENGSRWKFSLNDVYQHDMSIPLEYSSNQISVIVVFCKEENSSCVERLNPKVYVSNLASTAIFIGSFVLLPDDFSQSNFQFHVIGNNSIKEAYVILRGNYYFT